MVSARLPGSVAIALLALVIGVLGAGQARAATIDVGIGDLWFCTAAFELGDCENDSLGTTVFVGDTVAWTKTTVMAHTVTECTDDTFSSCVGGFNSGLLLGSVGETFSETFAHDGIFYYRCSLHPTQMRGRIVVTAQPTDRDGDTIVDELDPDDDNDGILDEDDACQFLAGIPELDGCPPPGPPLAVGGISGLLEADGPDDSAVSDGGSDIIGYAAALAGMAGAALIAAGWFLRRRLTA